MGSDVGQIFPTASLHRDHSISYALVCEKTYKHKCYGMTVFLQQMKVEFLKQSGKSSTLKFEISAINVSLQRDIKLRIFFSL